ncbi:MAG: STAS domain-containing protein [Parasporobacterium sp.]|nr:STAS domain-containing protein [Parasporobacterium sp.]
MTIRKELNGSSLVYQLEGRLDTNTAPELEKELKQDIVPITDLVFDLKDLDYISSAGLRVLLATQKIMNRQGKMTVRNPQEPIYEIFEVTGFTDILTIERD